MASRATQNAGRIMIPKCVRLAIGESNSVSMKNMAHSRTWRETNESGTEPLAASRANKATINKRNTIRSPAIVKVFMINTGGRSWRGTALIADDVWTGIVLSQRFTAPAMD